LFFSELACWRLYTVLIMFYLLVDICSFHYLFIFMYSYPNKIRIIRLKSIQQRTTRLFKKQQQELICKIKPHPLLVV
jgi:hypothetical protein